MGTDFFTIRCPHCGNIQVKEIRTDITKAVFTCQKCEVSTKIHDALKGKLRLDMYGAFDCKVANKVCSDWKAKGKVPGFVEYTILGNSNMPVQGGN